IRNSVVHINTHEFPMILNTRFDITQRFGPLAVVWSSSSGLVPPAVVWSQQWFAVVWSSSSGLVLQQWFGPPAEVWSSSRGLVLQQRFGPCSFSKGGTVLCRKVDLLDICPPAPHHITTFISLPSVSLLFPPR
uniref:Uncharacterized protein n=1 Tax=Myripristis murdjan TaxID=586833 RepID=A0A667XRD2_9TELE